MLKREEKRVAAALDLLREALVFIHEDSTVVAIESKLTSFPESTYTSGAGRRVVAITKTHGGRLQYLEGAVRHLEALLQTREVVKRESTL